MWTIETHGRRPLPPICHANGEIALQDAMAQLKREIPEADVRVDYETLMAALEVRHAWDQRAAEPPPTKTYLETLAERLRGFKPPPPSPGQRPTDGFGPHP
jgi:hypothetical protein